MKRGPNQIRLTGPPGNFSGLSCLLRLVLSRVMKSLPVTENSLVLRTDFSDESAWQRVRTAIEQPAGEFRAYVDFVSDPDFDGLTPEALASAHSPDSPHSFVFIIDRTALAEPDHPILVVDLFEQPGRTFRVIPAEAWSVENNLSLANMDFSEFAEAVDADGVFRGFPQT